MKKLFALAALCGALSGGGAFADEPRIGTAVPTQPAAHAPAPGCCDMSMMPQRPTTSVLGSGPLVNNVVAVGVQANVQNGQGNVGVNMLNVGQGVGSTGSGSLVNNTLATGAQLNTQLGSANLGANIGSMGQAVR